MAFILLLGIAVPLVAAACEKDCAPISSLLSECSLPPLTADPGKYKELTERNFIGLDESPLWSMGEPTHIIKDYKEARCLCIDARKDFPDCKDCIARDDYRNNNMKTSDRRRVLDYYRRDCDDLGFFANDTLAYPSTTRTIAPSATVTPDISVSEDCDELCGVINGQLHECDLVPLDAKEPRVTMVPSPGFDLYASLLLNRSAAECACTMPVLRRMYGCWKCWSDGDAPSPFNILDYNHECRGMGYWSDEEFIVVEEEESSGPGAPEPTIFDPVEDAASGPLELGGRVLVPVLLMLLGFHVG